MLAQFLVHFGYHPIRLHIACRHNGHFVRTSIAICLLCCRFVLRVLIRLKILHDFHDAGFGDSLQAARGCLQLCREAIANHLQPLGEHRTTQKCFIQWSLFLNSFAHMIALPEPALGHQFFVQWALFAQEYSRFAILGGGWEIRDRQNGVFIVTIAQRLLLFDQFWPGGGAFSGAGSRTSGRATGTRRRWCSHLGHFLLQVCTQRRYTRTRAHNLLWWRRI